MAAIADVVNSSWVLDNAILGARLDWFWHGFFDLLAAIGSSYAAWPILVENVVVLVGSQ